MRRSVLTLGLAVMSCVPLHPVLAATPVAASGTVPLLAHVVVIVEENEPYTSVVGNTAQAPYINGTLIPRGALATDYYAITNPSLPNYFALTYGSTLGVTNDLNPSQFTTNAASIANTLLAHGLTWKAYAESMPSNCDKKNASKYIAHHNPFVYSTALPSCAQEDVPYTQFASDLASAATLPTYSFIIPNTCDDGHNGISACGGTSKVNNTDRWLAAQVPAILASPAFTQQPSLLMITWDEGSKTTSTSHNHVVALFLGRAATSDVRDTTAYTQGHFALLHTIEVALGLPTLTTYDASAPLMAGMCAV